MHQPSGSWKVLLWLLLPWWWSNAWRFLQSLLHPSCLSQPERPPHHLLWQRSQAKTNQIIATPLQANLTGATTLWSRWSAIFTEWPSRQSLRLSTSPTWIMMYVRLWESLNLFSFYISSRCSRRSSQCSTVSAGWSRSEKKKSSGRTWLSRALASIHCPAKCPTVLKRARIQQTGLFLLDQKCLEPMKGVFAQLKVFTPPSSNIQIDHRFTQEIMIFRGPLKVA